MASSPIQLDSIPVEIIQRIASFSPCESVLALLRVNRRLYKACNDDAVFKAVIRNGNGQNIIQPWDSDLLSQTASRSGWARFALADSRARRWIAPAQSGGQNGDRGSPEDTRIGDIWRWAPQLVALQHPFIAEGDVLGLVSRFNSLWTADLDTSAIDAKAFCIAATILHHGTQPGQNAEDHASSDRPIHRDLRKIMLDVKSSSSPAQHYIYGAMPSLLACALIGNAHLVSQELPPPSPARMPLLSLLDLSVPFSSRGLSRARYLPMMTAPAFLEAGEWVGYYSYSLNLDVARFDPPMKGIRFTVTRDPLSHPGTLGLSAPGTDNVGHFSLRGAIDQSGIVRIRKFYAAGFQWDWDGRMTPFGIVGAWGTGRSKHGHFWLWKREWSQI